jgi:hypothetical protein
VERENPAAPKPLDHVLRLGPGSPVARAGGFLVDNHCLFELVSDEP